MASQVADLISKLKPDAWRESIGFSDDLNYSNETIWASQKDERAVADELRKWLTKGQPCLFGKAASARDLISFCVLSESDLARSDEAIRDKIQDSRLRWLADANDGSKSGFIILAISPMIAHAVPSEDVKQLAKRLAFLYLEIDIQEDHVHLDEIFLTKPGRRQDVVWRWDVGVNYFCAQGDRRWWHDHRIPAGLAFSMNSVGHMVKAAQLSETEKKSYQELSLEPEDIPASNIQSLAKALELAMKTISKAADTAWGKATELLPLSSHSENLPKCPIELPADLRDKNHCEYQGYYHTDYSLPAEYFVPDPWKPQDPPTYALDFTYLFHDDIANPAHRSMGKGRRVKADGEGAQTLADVLKEAKPKRAVAEEVTTKDQLLLQQALARYRKAKH